MLFKVLLNVNNLIRSRKKKYCEPMCKLFYIKQKFGHGADDDHSMLVYDDCMMMMMIREQWIN